MRDIQLNPVISSDKIPACKHGSGTRIVYKSFPNLRLEGITGTADKREQTDTYVHFAVQNKPLYVVITLGLASSLIEIDQ